MANLDLHAYRYFMASPVKAALIEQGLLGFDPPGRPFEDGWVFRGDQDTPYKEVTTSGKCAIVFESSTVWSTPSQFQQNVEFPRLDVAIYADASRDSKGNYIKHDAQDRAKAVFDAIKPLFHDAANRVHYFDTLMVVSTLLGSGPTIMPIPGADFAERLTASFNCQI